MTRRLCRDGGGTLIKISITLPLYDTNTRLRTGSNFIQLIYSIVYRSMTTTVYIYL